MNLATTLKNTYSDMSFDKLSHTYTYKQRKLTPTSNKVKEFVEPFDTKGIVKAFALKNNLKPIDVEKMWTDGAKVACDYGTAIHDFGERYAIAKFINHTDLSVFIPSNAHETAVIKFWNDIPRHIEVVCFELRMYSAIYGFAGTCDILLRNKNTGKLILSDYKTNKDLFKNFRKKTMLSPFNFLLDMPFNHYQLQLCFYQLLLEEQGYEVEERHIVWLLPDGTYKLYKTKDFTKTLKTQLCLQEK